MNSTRVCYNKKHQLLRDKIYAVQEENLVKSINIGFLYGNIRFTLLLD